MKYTPAVEGEWVQPRDPKAYKVGCCHCGLVHRIEFRVVAGRVQFRAEIDRRATAAKRRERRKREGGA